MSQSGSRPSEDSRFAPSSRERVLEKLPDSNRDPRHIRFALAEDEAPATEKRVCYPELSGAVAMTKLLEAAVFAVVAVP